MLLKKIISTYGNSIAGKGDFRGDVLFEVAATAGVQQDAINYRTKTLEELSRCRPFFLDHTAASFVNTFVKEMSQDGNATMKDVSLPEEIIWVEMDEAALAYSKQKQGHPVSDREIETLNMQGVLIDNTYPDFLSVQVFASSSENDLFEPATIRRIPKGKSGNPDLSQSRIWENKFMRTFVTVAPGMSELSAESVFLEDVGLTSDLYMMTYALFSLIKSKSPDVEFSEGSMFSEKEMRTARKFGKSHITSAPNSHITISLTEPGKRYMAQLEDDAEDRRRVAAGGAPKVRHEVREHTRRYKSGLVITVKAHERGSEPDRRPTRVTASEPEEMPSM